MNQQNKKHNTEMEKSAETIWQNKINVKLPREDILFLATFWQMF